MSKTRASLAAESAAVGITPHAHMAGDPDKDSILPIFGQIHIQFHVESVPRQGGHTLS